MNVYIVYSIPDYYGIDVEKVFLDEKKAEKYVDDWNKSHDRIYALDYFHFEVSE